jgi:hypothetical protein
MNLHCRFILLGVSCGLMIACRKGDNPAAGSPAAPISISAIDLHKAYAADAAAAAKRFEGKPLVITGEVKLAAPAFLGHTMSGQITVPAKISFKTEVDYLPHDIKYVVCEGHFEDRATMNLWGLDSRIKVGQMLTVRCSAAKIRWTDPGLYVEDCEMSEQQPAAAADPKSDAPIGVATMDDDGKIILQLRAEGPNGMRGDGRLVYAPGDKDYQSILDHLGPLKKGETILVKPWPDAK